jgi:hypothetical protein
MPEVETADPAIETQPIDAIFEGPASTEVAETGAPDEGQEPAVNEPEGQDDQELAGLIEKYAKQYGLKDLNDPDAWKSTDLPKLFKQLADKENFIQKLKGQTKPPEVPWNEGLEQAPADARADKAPPDQQQPPQERQDEQAPPDIGASWRAQEDAIADMNEAWAAGDFKKVSEVENAMWARQFVGMGLPHMQRIVQQAVAQLRNELQDVVPAMREGVQRQQVQQDKDFAISQLRGNPDYAETIEDLFKVEEGPNIQYNGEEFPNTPYNRMLAEHPHLLKIREMDENPRVAQRKTAYTRYEAALRLYKTSLNGSLGPEKAQQLVEAGKKIAGRNEKDRVRRGLNAGPGSRQTGGRPERDYASTLQDLPGYGAVDELFK